MKTVIIVEDDTDLRVLMKDALLSLGLEVLEAENGAVAEAEIANDRVDLALVDGLLPDATGLELIERIRANSRSLPIVFMSAHFRDLKTFNRLTNEYAVSMVLYKPVDPNQVASQILGLLEPRLSMPAASQTGPEMPDGGNLFEGLRREFAQRLPARVDELAVAVEAARHDASMLVEARALAHRLRGTAGSYGHHAVGEAAGLVEDLLDELVSRRADGRFHWERVNNALNDARIAVALAPLREKRSEQTSTPSQRRLLVISEDQDFLRTVLVVARKSLIHVIHARTTVEALRTARQFAVGVLVIDVELGEEESLAFVSSLQSTCGNESIAIAFAASDRRMETRVAAVRAGATRFFEKPISETAFTEVLLQIMAGTDSQKGHVLIVDDDPDIVACHSDILQSEGYVVESLGSADLLVEKLEQSRVDVLLLDVSLPKISGIDVCRALRMSDQWTLLPIVIVTAHSDATTRLRAFRAGASDVITKPVLAEELLARVQVQAERLQLVRDRADKDALSGLLLRRAMLEAFQRVLAMCARDEKRLAVVLFDIDKFKRINDEFGHLAGDRVIAALGELMRRRFRVEDLRSRWGGEEFLLVLPSAGSEFATEAAERLLKDFSLQSFQAEDGRSFSATFTAGVAEFPTDGTSTTALIRYADEMLYAGKRAGRNRVACKGKAT